MLFNAIVLALREIRRNVLRSSLTTLGIIIGVASVIIMVTLGNGATAQVTADIASMGANLLTVMPGQRVGPGGASGSSKPFRQQDVNVLGREVTSVTAIAPVSTIGLSVISGAKNRSTTVTGTTNAYFESGNWKLGRRTLVLGQRAAIRARPSASSARRRAPSCSERTDAIGSRLRLRSVSCT
jgi:putative ABC transport system permease protein